MNLAKSTRIGLAHVNKNRTWLAGKLNVTEQYIGQICNGQKKPNLNRIQSMSRLFGVKVSVFISWGEQEI